MNLDIARLRCPLCNARLLSGYTVLDSADDRFERIEIKCRQKHVVRLTVRKVGGEDGVPCLGRVAVRRMDGAEGEGAERQKRA